MYPTHCNYVIKDSDISMVTEDVMAWQTAPPVRICSYIIVGNEKDASSKECFERFGIKYVLNVTNKCPNYFEDDVKMRIKYFRIPAQDNGKMRLLDYFEVANRFISELLCLYTYRNVLVSVWDIGGEAVGVPKKDPFPVSLLKVM